MPELLKARRASSRLVTSTLVVAVALLTLTLNGCSFFEHLFHKDNGAPTAGTPKEPCGPEAPCQPRTLKVGDAVGGTTCACGNACMSSGALCQFGSGHCTLVITGTCSAGGAKCACACF
jgi:hypothetical protein